MSWNTVRLGNIAEFSNGINFDKSAYDSGIKLINVSNFGKQFSPEYGELSEVNSGVVRDSDLLQNGDIVFVRSNGNKELVGRCMLVRNLTVPTTFSGFVIRCRLSDFTKYDPVFFTYHFKNKAFRRAMAGTAVGANIQNLSQGRLSSYVVRIPDYSTQRRIADILFSYDNLIENNQKQIKLLEEAAQRLYKEWFFDLRFPGHENTPIVDGVPEGWKKGPLGAIAQFKRGQVITREQIHSGDVPVVAGGLEPAYYHDKANTIAPVITVSGSGANAGFTRLYDVDVFASDCSFADCRTTPYLFFVYCLLKESKIKLNALQKGSAQPHVYAKDINALSVIVPREETIELFCHFVSSFFEESKILQRKIEIAKQARDRLLPKLMSGEIEV